MPTTTNLGMAVSSNERDYVLEYWMKMLNEENGNFVLLDKEFGVLASKLAFTIYPNTWVAEEHAPFYYKSVVTLNAVVQDNSIVEAYFENILVSTGVILHSVTQNGTSLELVFYADAAKQEPVSGFIKYVYSVAGQDPLPVPEANVEPKTITENGTYDAHDINKNGYNPVTVNVSAHVSPLSVTANGTYQAPEGEDGYNPVNVNVTQKVVFDFSNSRFTSMSQQLFYNNTSFSEVVTLILPNTLTSINTNMWQGATGNYKTYFNSIPTVGSNSYIPADTQSLALKYYFDISNIAVISANNWSTRVSQMVFSATGIASGTALQPYTIQTGAVITWYTDDDTFLNQVTESSSATATYYARILNPTTRVVWYLKELTLSYATCDIVDGQGNHYDLNNRFIPVGTVVTITPVMTDPDKDILLKFSVNGVDITGDSATVTVTSDLSVIVAYSDTNISPTLDYNTWAVIKQTCEANIAGNYWAIGDTKTDVGTDGNNRTMRICDMQGLYGKHVVFEQVELETNDYQWNPSSNVDTDNAYNNYSISNMRTTHLPAILLKYSSALQENLTNTTYKVATNGNNGTILDLTDKLFLPAEKELFVSSSYSRSEERNVLTTFQYYVTHNSNNYRIKYKLGQTSGYYWWERSPYSGYTSFVCRVGGSGGADYSGAGSSLGVAPCFAF